MLTIARLTSDYRIAGDGPDRALTAARLDRLVRGRLKSALDAVLGPLDDEDGPVWRIRRVDIALWLDLDRFTDQAFARDWAETIARALYRQIAEGAPSDVVRYDSRADYLASYLSDLLGGDAQNWTYDEFRHLDGVPAGRAIAAALVEHPDVIGAVLATLQQRRRLAAVIQPLGADDVATIWLGWTGVEPSPGRVAAAGLVALARAAMPRPPVLEASGRDVRGRNALRLLVGLTSGPGGLRAEVAAPLAMQLAALAAVGFALPDLPRWPTIAALGLTARRRLADAVAALTGVGPAAGWVAQTLAEPDGAAALARIAALLDEPPAVAAAAPEIERRVSVAAGLGLLLPAARAMELGDRIGAEGLCQLLTLLAGPRRQALIADDPAPTWFSGVADAARPRAMAARVAWPDAAALGIASDALARDEAELGTGPAAPLARALLDRFATGLRGMEGSSAGYLARQFLAADGTLVREAGRLTVRLHRAPLGVLLRMAGRLGDQGPLPWLSGAELRLEIGDG